VPDRPVTQQERDEAIQKLNEVLIKRKYDRNKYATPEESPQIFSIDNPGMGKYEDDPIGMFGVQEFARQNPDAYKRAGAVNVGRPVLPTIHGTAYGTTWKNPMTGEPVISLLHSGKSLSNPDEDPFKRIMNTIRHEYGHVMGLNDQPDPVLYDIPTTYDVGNWSDTLHRDIALPSFREQSPTQKMQSLMPYSTKVR
jgi:hypothetical protein